MSMKHKQVSRATKLARRDMSAVPMHRESLKKLLKSGKYTSHIGAKEQERAKRLWESEALGAANCNMNFRCFPTLCQLSKKSFEAADSEVLYG